MKDLTLVIMAAGMGSRFGGLKQIESIDKYGHILMDYSIYDAYLSGFSRIIFIINSKIAEDFRRIICPRLLKWHIDIDYVFQEVTLVPSKYQIPPDRKKPWGTAHAVACLDGIIDNSFAVINADDFYGRDAFLKMAQFLKSNEEECSLIGYRLEDTLSRSGCVCRGVCSVEQGMLESIKETSGIVRTESGIVSKDNLTLSPDATVSMNFWGLTPNIISECRDSFSEFLDTNLPLDPLGCEFYLPEVISHLINNEKTKVNVINSASKWYGVTYKKDKSEVSLALENMIDMNVYPFKSE